MENPCCQIECSVGLSSWVTSFPGQLLSSSEFENAVVWDFPGGPVVKIPGRLPPQGAWVQSLAVPHAARHSQNINK